WTARSSSPVRAVRRRTADPARARRRAPPETTRRARNGRAATALRRAPASPASGHSASPEFRRPAARAPPRTGCVPSATGRLSSRSVTQLAEKPRARQCPAPLERRRRNAKRIGGFLDAQPGEIAQLDDLR